MINKKKEAITKRRVEEVIGERTTEVTLAIMKLLAKKIVTSINLM